MRTQALTVGALATTLGVTLLMLGAIVPLQTWSEWWYGNEFEFFGHTGSPGRVGATGGEHLSDAVESVERVNGSECDSWQTQLISRAARLCVG